MMVVVVIDEGRNIASLRRDKGDITSLHISQSFRSRANLHVNLELAGRLVGVVVDQGPGTYFRRAQVKGVAAEIAILTDVDSFVSARRSVFAFSHEDRVVSTAAQTSHVLLE